MCGLVIGSILGCGGPSAPVRKLGDVTGKVTYKGVPLKIGTIVFQPDTGAFATAEIQPDGTYSLKGALGPNLVTITSRDPMPPGPDDPVARNARRPKSNIPEAYGERTSGLKFDVQNKPNVADFNLK